MLTLSPTIHFIIILNNFINVHRFFSFLSITHPSKTYFHRFLWSVHIGRQLALQFLQLVYVLHFIASPRTLHPSSPPSLNLLITHTSQPYSLASAYGLLRQQRYLHRTPTQHLLSLTSFSFIRSSFLRINSLHKEEDSFTISAS